MLSNILKSITPASLKKYGMYSMLCFFMSLSLWFIVSDRNRNKEEIQYQRQKNEELQDLLLEQSRLRIEQMELLKKANESLWKADSVRNLSSDIVKQSEKLK